MDHNALLEIEESISENRDTLVLAEALRRLQNNRDFKLIVSTGYLQKEAVRLVGLKADPGMQGAAEQQQILRQLDSIGCFQQYLLGIHRAGEIAEKGISDAEQIRDQILKGTD